MRAFSVLMATIGLFLLGFSAPVLGQHSSGPPRLTCESCNVSGAGTEVCSNCGGGTLTTGSFCRTCCQTSTTCVVQPETIGGAPKEKSGRRLPAPPAIPNLQ